MPGRTIAIGDVHGCRLALAALLDAINPTAEDTLVTLGDYIDRGPDSRGVLDLLIALERRSRLVPLLGNHEEMLLAARTSLDIRMGWLACGGVEAIASYGYFQQPAGAPTPLDELIPAGHWQFLERCLPFFETETHLFLHANYDPELPLHRQTATTLRWKFVDARTARRHRCGKVAIVGHTPQRSGEILDLQFLKCIDTGCHAGGWLTALEVHTGQVWQADKNGRLRHS
jgi:serine/threonine protein phosphatase 1